MVRAVDPPPRRHRAWFRWRTRATAWAAGVSDIPLYDVSGFRSRFRDIAGPLLRVLHMVDPDAIPGVIGLLRSLESDRRTDASRSWEGRLAVALWDHKNKVTEGRVFVADLLPGKVELLVVDAFHRLFARIYFKNITDDKPRVAPR